MDKETLRSRADAVKALRADLTPAHDALVDAVWEAADEGWPQVEIVRETGLTRERIRQLCDPEYRERAMVRRKEAGG